MVHTLCTQQQSSPTFLALSGQFIPTCHLMIQLQLSGFELNFSNKLRRCLFAPAACVHSKMPTPVQ